jgi:hypothetical protein
MKKDGSYKMKEAKFSIPMATLLALMATALALSAGCGKQTGAPSSPSTATLSEATMCKNYNYETGAGDNISVFLRNDPWIMCSVKLSEAPAGTSVQAVWFYQGNERRSETQVADGTKYLGFKVQPKNFRSNATRFDAGDCAVKLYLDDQEKITLQYTVQ